MILKKIKNIVKWVVVLFFSTTILAVVAYRFIPVYVTPLMFIRCFQQVADGESITLHHHWVSMDKISPHMPVAVMASEDLASCGVTSRQVKNVQGFGSANPVVNTTAACAQNRRVEVYMYASQAMINAANNGTLK
jgi:hypothetical protein